MIVECRTDYFTIGDSLCMVPLMLELAKTKEVYVTGRFAEPVKELCKNFPLHFETPPFLPSLIYNLSAQDAWQFAHRNGQQLHMAQAHFGVQNLPIPGYPCLKLYEREPIFPKGIIISPFAVSDSMFIKRWCISRWREFIHHFLSEHIVYVIGADTDNTEDFEAAGAHAIKGFPLPDVLGMMRHSKAFVSIDTGTAHMAMLSGLSNHVLLYPDQLIRKFAESPYAETVRGLTNMDISVHDVIRATERVLCR